MSDDDQRLRAAQAEQQYREWAQREREAGNLDRAMRLEGEANILRRIYVRPDDPAPETEDDQESSGSRRAGLGCLSGTMLVGLASAVTWRLWELMTQ